MPASQCFSEMIVRRALFATVVTFASLAWMHSAYAATCPGNLGATTTPTSDFVVNANGTVNHTPTGLMWKQCNESLTGTTCATGAASFQDWPAALATARSSTFAGYTDWRLPNKQELESLVDNTCHSPAINDTVFPATVANWTWTSTTYNDFPAYAWIVYFNDGNSVADVKSNGNGAVRLVRGGQSFDPLAALAAQTLTFGVAPSGVTVGGTPTVTATSANPNSGNPVTYTSQTPGACSVIATTGVVSALTVGTCTIAANQAGNASYSAAPSLTQSFPINGLPILNIDNSDASTQYGAATDGVLLMRYLLGYRNAALVNGALGSGSALRDATQIATHISANLAAFDVDSDGETLALTDGLMILRRLLGLSGSALTANAKRGGMSDTQIQTAIDALRP